VHLELSDLLEVNYYRCDHCLLIWNVPKNGAPTVKIVAAPEWPPRRKFSGHSLDRPFAERHASETSR